MTEYKSKKEAVSRKWMLSLLLLVLSALMLMTVFASGNFRWLLAFIAVFIVGIEILRRAFENTKGTDLWRRENILDEVVHLNLSKISIVADKAVEGKKLSRWMIEKKIRDEMLKMVKRKRRLSEEEVERISQNKELAEEVIGDEKLADFFVRVSKRKRVLREEKRGHPFLDRFRKPKKDMEYRSYLIDILERMEGWG